MAVLNVGRIYRDDTGKTVLVFGVVSNPLEEGSAFTVYTGIGFNLSTGKVDEIGEDVILVDSVTGLDVVQTENYGYFNKILHLMEGKVVPISGKARTGKDTLADMLTEKVGSKRIALADPIRQVAKIVYGNPIKKDRKNLIMIGQGLRSQDPHVWIKAWLRSAAEHFNYDNDAIVVVTDVRQPNEFQFFTSMGALTLSIKVDEEKRRKMLAEVDGEIALDATLLNDETESHVSAFATEIVLINDYGPGFKEEVNSVVERLTNDEG